MSRYLIIEGTPETRNGSLRVAFGRLLEKAEVQGVKPVMGGSWSDVLKKYKEYPNCTAFLLVDMDELDPTQTDHIPQQKLHVMRPSFEEWLILEGAALCQYYKLPSPPQSKTNKPKQAIKDWLKKNKKKSEKEKSYHEVRDASKLLPTLDINKLKTSVPEFSDLLEALSAK